MSRKILRRTGARQGDREQDKGTQGRAGDMERTEKLTLSVIKVHSVKFPKNQ